MPQIAKAVGVSRATLYRPSRSTTTASRRRNAPAHYGFGDERERERGRSPNGAAHAEAGQRQPCRPNTPKSKERYSAPILAPSPARPNELITVRAMPGTPADDGRKYAPASETRLT